MEIASSLPISHSHGGTERAFVYSPFMDGNSNTFGLSPCVDVIDNFSSCGVSVTNVDMSRGNAFKRYQFTTDKSMKE